MSQERLRHVLVAGCLGFGAWALVRPESCARLIASDVDTARELGIRDLGSAVAIAYSSGRGALAARVLYDLSDAALFGPRNPKVAALALGFAGVGVAALRAS